MTHHVVIDGESRFVPEIQVRIRVDGEDQFVSLTTLKADFQIGECAQVRLQEAAPTP